jgi:ferrous iron transport protein B
MNRGTRKIALVGNPNIGKSSLFNQLTGLQQKIGNFAGVTIEKKTGSFNSGNFHYEVTDLPGAYSLIPKSPDEVVVFHEIVSAINNDWVFVVVLDATNLARNLLLFSQLADLQQPCIVAVTMSDVAKKRGIEVDFEALEKKLGCPVVAVNGRTGEGTEKPQEATRRSCRSQVPNF